MAREKRAIRLLQRRVDFRLKLSRVFHRKVSHSYGGAAQLDGGRLHVCREVLTDFSA